MIIAHQLVAERKQAVLCLSRLSAIYFIISSENQAFHSGMMVYRYIYRPLEAREIAQTVTGNRTAPEMLYQLQKI